MPRPVSIRRILLLGALLALPLAAAIEAAEPGTPETSGFGAVAIPEPPRAVFGDSCVEPVEVMRREHMHFLDHQRDRTVIDGERDGRYSLAGCLDCHNPRTAGVEAPRYGDAEHFCSACHRYASVRIDCFECHADRGEGDSLRSGLDTHTLARADARLDAATLRYRMEAGNAQ